MIKVEIYKTVERDHWSEGCDPDSYQDYGCIMVETFDNMDSFKQYLEQCWNDLNCFEVYEDNNCLEYCQNEDINCNQIQLTEDNPEGYLVSYTFYVTEVFENAINLKKYFTTK